MLSYATPNEIRLHAEALAMTFNVLLFGTMMLNFSIFYVGKKIPAYIQRRNVWITAMESFDTYVVASATHKRQTVTLSSLPLLKASLAG